MSSEWEFADDVALLRKHASALADDLVGFTGIRSVLEWMQQRGLTKARIDIIAQDEFHYDFLIELEAAGRWISFGVT